MHKIATSPLAHAWARFESHATYWRQTLSLAPTSAKRVLAPARSDLSDAGGQRHLTASELSQLVDLDPSIALLVQRTRFHPPGHCHSAAFGLVARMTGMPAAVDGSFRQFWNNLAKLPFDQFDPVPYTSAAVRQALEYRGVVAFTGWGSRLVAHDSLQRLVENGGSPAAIHAEAGAWQAAAGLVNHSITLWRTVPGNGIVPADHVLIHDQDPFRATYATLYRRIYPAKELTPDGLSLHRGLDGVDPGDRGRDWAHHMFRVEKLSELMDKTLRLGVTPRAMAPRVALPELAAQPPAPPNVSGTSSRDVLAPSSPAGSPPRRRHPVRQVDRRGR